MTVQERAELICDIADLVRKYQWDSADDEAESLEIAGTILRLFESKGFP